MGNRWLRLRALVGKHAGVFAVVLIGLALVGGWLTYGAYVEPGTTTTERTASSWSVTGEYNHSATVTEPNPVREVGTTLSNQSVYLMSIAPVVDGTFKFRYQASDSGDLDIDIRGQTVHRSVEEREGNSVELWRQSRELENRSVDSAGPDSTVTIPFSVNASDAQNRTGTLESELDNPPGETQFSVVTTVSISGTVNGQSVARTMEYELPVTFEGGAYRLEASSETAQFETTETVAVQRQPTAVESIGGPALLGVSLAGLVGFLVRRETFELSDAERKRLQFGDDREALGEWINQMTLPEEVYDRQTIQTESLADLVNFAIDTNNSVIQDDGYYVLHDGMLYTYDPPTDDSTRPEFDFAPDGTVVPVNGNQADAENKSS